MVARRNVGTALRSAPDETGLGGWTTPGPGHKREPRLSKRGGTKNCRRCGTAPWSVMTRKRGPPSSRARSLHHLTRPSHDRKVAFVSRAAAKCIDRLQELLNDAGLLGDGTAGKTLLQLSIARRLFWGLRCDDASEGYRPTMRCLRTALSARYIRRTALVDAASWARQEQRSTGSLKPHG